MKIPGYIAKRRIAEGGMATVYLAEQKSLRRDVALKLLKKFNSREQLKRFLHEARIIASLNHRNVITIYDIGMVGDRLFFSMEFLHGGDLEDRLATGVDREDALNLIEAIGSCLQFVHEKGVVHRDIKPANILFHEDGTPILTDFGVAKTDQVDSKLTMDGTALGSPYYLSPEQAECRAVDGRSDLYGLGIILFEMLTGRKPYIGDSYMETIIEHLTQPIPTLPEEHRYYQTVIDRMLEKDPDKRFTSAHEMVTTLRKLRLTEPIYLTAERYADRATDALDGLSIGRQED